MARPGLERERVVREAIRLADERGLAQLSWSLVASSLGVKPPSLYNHVGGFEELKNELALRGVNGMLAALERETTLGGMGRAYVTFARQHRGLYEAAVRAPGPGAAELATQAARVVALVAAPMERLGVPAAQRVHAIRVFRSALHGFVSLEASGGFGLPDPLDATLETLIDAMVRGLTPATKEELA